MRPTLSALLLLLLGANASGAAPVESSEAMLAELTALTSEAACRSDDDCATVAVGARSCGGPDHYLAWSRRTTDARRLSEVATRYEAMRRAENQLSGVMSTCRFIADPGAFCATVDSRAVPMSGPSPLIGRCTLRSGASRLRPDAAR